MPTQPQVQRPASKRGAPPPAAPEVRVSRIARMEADGIEPQMPEVTPGTEYLVGHLFEVGPVAQTGYGVAALSWTDLHAWQQQIGVELSAWEARTLRRLSADFAAESRRADEWGVASPMAIATTAKQRETVARRVGIEFGAMAAAQRSMKGRQ